MKTFVKMLMLELKISFRNIIFVISTIILPLLLVLLFGGIYGNDPSPIFGGYGAVSASIPAYIALSLAIIALTGMTLQLVSYKENKVLKRLKATPIKKTQILLPIFANYLILFFVGTAILFIAGSVLYDVTLTGNIFAFGFSLILSILAMFSLGFLLSCLCSGVKQITGIGFAILVPMIFLSGATMPMGAFPDVMQNISKFVPLTYCVEFMQNMFLGKPISDNVTSIIVLCGITVVCTFLSFKLFKWE